MVKNLYEILGIPSTANAREIEEAYKNVLQQGNKGIPIQEIYKAYETLIDPELRRMYDYKEYYKATVKNFIIESFNRIMPYILGFFIGTLMYGLQFPYSGIGRWLRSLW